MKLALVFIFGSDEYSMAFFGALYRDNVGLVVVLVHRKFDTDFALFHMQLLQTAVITKLAILAMRTSTIGVYSLFALFGLLLSIIHH